MKLPEIPAHIEKFTDVHQTVQPLYEFNERGGYSLSPGGRQLQRVRKAMLESPGLPSLPAPAAGREPTLKLSDWQLTMACAAPQERKILIAAAAQRHILIKI